MTTTVFVNGVTLTDADWFNDVDGVTYDGVVPLQNYGALGDGVTNDQAAVDAWLVACAGRTGYAPAGTYMVDSIAPASGTLIRGDGPSVTVFKARTNNDAPVIDLGTKSDITLKDFSVNGNSAVKAGGPGQADGVLLTNGNRIRCENVLVTDCQDWGFVFLQGSDIRLTNCSVTNLKGGIDANSVRGGYLLGATGTSLNDAFCTGCTASGTGTTIFYDGFVSEVGVDHRFIGCHASVPYTGFKLKGDRVAAIGCHASACTVGFQTQNASQGLVINGCTAYRCLDSGFKFGLLTGTGRNWIVTGNNAIENGQDAVAATRYGFAFEQTAGTIIDGCNFVGNIARDTQGAPTQARGFSWSSVGTISNLLVTGNIGLGHASDYNYGSSIEQTSVVIGPNAGLTGSALFFTPAQAAHRLNFWTDNAAAGAGVTSLSDGLSGRGYVMPRAGYVVTQASRATAAVTAGSITFAPRKNGSNFTSNLTHDAAAGTFAQTDETPRAKAFVAGDIITCIFTSTGGLLPAGTNDFDVVVDVVYT